MEVRNFVSFKDVKEHRSTPHFGLLLDDKNIICLCCGGIVPPKDYEIIGAYGKSSLIWVDEILQKDFL